MTNYHEEETVPVPRKRLFVLRDGRFVIQWEENRVQDVLTGRYSSFVEEDFGNAITDYELNQLQNSGVVAAYDQHLIYLEPDVNVTPNGSPRTYYLNTRLHKSRVDDVVAAIQKAELHNQFAVRLQEVFVIIRGANGTAYVDFDHAERARETLIEHLPDLLGNAVVAFVEITATP